MAAFLRKNFAFGSLAVQLTAVATQMTLNVGHTLPTDAGSFRVVIWNIVTFPNPADDPDAEIVTATYSGGPNIYNIVRAQEDTLQLVHAVGSEVALHYTAGVSDDDLDWLGSRKVNEAGIGNGMVPVVSGSNLVYRKILEYDTGLAALIATV
jgi:hypothetical protein